MYNLNVGQKAHMAVSAFAMSIVLLAGVSTVNYFSAKEQKKIASESQSSVAMKMAEQGLARAVWKLQERSDHWTTLMKGQAISGYNFDQVYTESGGEYVVKIEKATAANINNADFASKVLMTVIGRDSDHSDTKAIKVIYRNENEKPDYAVYVMNNKTHKRKSQDNLDKAIDKKQAFLTQQTNQILVSAKSFMANVSGIFADNAYAAPDEDFEYDFDEDQFRGVHWGALICLGTWKMVNKYNRYWASYPRKFATGGISGRDEEKNSPNSDGVEWWSYNEDVPSSPILDYNYYRSLAMNSGVDPATGSRPIIMGKTLAGAIYHVRGNGSHCIPPHGNRKGKFEDKNEGEYLDSHWLKGEVDDPNSPRLYFFDGLHGKITGETFLNGLIIVNGGRLEFKSGIRKSTTGEYTANLPVNAWKEYGKIDTIASGEYPGDAGYQTLAATYNFSGDNAITVHGLIYSTEKVSLAGKAIVHGVVISGHNFHFDGKGECAIYYDDTLRIKSTETSLVQEQYNEVAMTWPL